MGSQASLVRPRARTAITRDRIEEAALGAFSEVGFDAASTREIASRAETKQQLITYHYGSKLELWKAVVNRSFGELRERMDARLAGLEGVDEPTRFRLLLREFVLFSAEHPEIARFMMHESARLTPRLQWLYDRHTRPFIELLMERIAWAQGEGIATAGDPAHLVFVILGAVGMLAHSAEAELMTSGRSREPESLEGYVDLIVRLVLPGDSGSVATPPVARQRKRR